MQLTKDMQRDHGMTALLATYAVAALLLVSVSARLWWQSPLDLTPHEFDYFLGLFDSEDLRRAILLRSVGQGLQALGFVIMGALFLTLVRKLAEFPDALSERQIAAWSAGIAVIFALGLPWVSPDVFSYIGSGWADRHYHLSPYVAGVNAVPGADQEQMFANIFPQWRLSPTAYGPLFQEMAALLAGLSGGNIKLALVLFKVVALILHAGCSALVWYLAPASLKRAALLSYAANPLICFTMLTCVHNDHWMNLFVLLALLAVTRRRWLLAGVALGAAFGTKYFPLVFLPVFGLAALVQQREGRGRERNVVDAAVVVAGFAAITVLAYLPYPGALKSFSSVLSTGVTVYRNSVYHFINLFTINVLPGLLHTQPAVVTYETAGGAMLRGIFIALYAVMLLLMIDRLRRDPLKGIAEGCLAATVLYFILVNTGVQEWYLTWMMGLALVLPYERARNLALGLSACFLPLVIYTVKSPMLILEGSNFILYSLMLLLGGWYLASLARTIAPSREQESPG